MQTKHVGVILTGLEEMERHIYSSPLKESGKK